MCDLHQLVEPAQRRRIAVLESHEQSLLDIAQLMRARFELLEHTLEPQSAGKMLVNRLFKLLHRKRLSKCNIDRLVPGLRQNRDAPRQLAEHKPGRRKRCALHAIASTRLGQQHTDLFARGLVHKHNHVHGRRAVAQLRGPAPQRKHIWENIIQRNRISIGLHGCLVLGLRLGRGDARDMEKQTHRQLHLRAQIARLAIVVAVRCHHIDRGTVHQPSGGIKRNRDRQHHRRARTSLPRPARARDLRDCQRVVCNNKGRRYKQGNKNLVDRSNTIVGKHNLCKHRLEIVRVTHLGLIRHLKAHLQQLLGLDLGRPGFLDLLDPLREILVLRDHFAVVCGLSRIKGSHIRTLRLCAEIADPQHALLVQNHHKTADPGKCAHGNRSGLGREPCAPQQLVVLDNIEHAVVAANQHIVRPGVVARIECHAERRMIEAPLKPNHAVFLEHKHRPLAQSHNVALATAQSGAHLDHADLQHMFSEISCPFRAQFSRIVVVAAVVAIDVL
eukprot:comp21109_c0_seq1/m.44576 comp21109_c0_seq1/g.44576  ORF comp21109_c0_seq1/g.44576 comp21109_c0_seq1/m.44576 type:complete len:501 (+) comp21109_c0_seq1:473-1975(+)